MSVPCGVGTFSVHTTGTWSYTVYRRLLALGSFRTLTALSWAASGATHRSLLLSNGGVVSMDLLLHEPLNAVSSRSSLVPSTRVQQSHLLALGRAGEASVGR